MKRSIAILIIALLYIPTMTFAETQAELDARAAEIKQAGIDAQALVDQHMPGGVPAGKQVVVTQKIKTKVTGVQLPPWNPTLYANKKNKPKSTVEQKTTQKIEVVDITPRNPNEIRLGCTDVNSPDCKYMAWQLKQHLEDLYTITIVPGKSSVLNLAGIRDDQLDWAIINADALLFHDKLLIEVITTLPPKYAHLILRRMNNDDIEDLDDLDGNDMMAVGEKYSDAWSTWNILQNTFPDYLLIPTIKHDSYRALNSTRSGFTQGFFQIADKQNPVAMKANHDETLKMINIDNDAIYGISVRGYSPYKKVYFGDNMYDNLITKYWYSQISTIEVLNVLVSSKGWYQSHGDNYDMMYPMIERALANANRGVLVD